jgi:phage/plasmid-associated DNA primase
MSVDNIVKTVQASQLLEVLTREGYEHLQSEGFSDEHLATIVSTGVRWVDEAEALALGFKWRHPNKGLYFPSTQHLRPFPAATKANGDEVKYLRSKATWVAPTDIAYQVETEGAKDALAGSLIGGIPTLAKPGVSFYSRPEWQCPTVKVTLYDSDTWVKPQLITFIVKAAIAQRTLIQVVPECKGFEKSGLVEFFKSGKNAQDYKALIDSAMNVHEFLTALPGHWQEQKLDKKSVDRLTRTAIKLIGEASLSPVELDRVLDSFKKHTGLTKDTLKREIAEKRLNKSLATIKADRKFDPNRLVKEETLEVHILKRVFRGSETPYVVIDGVFYRYTGLGYWELVSEAEIKRIIAEECEKCWTLEKKGDEWSGAFEFGTDKNVSSTFKFCRDSLASKVESGNGRYICFKNCTLDTETGKITNHSASHYLTSQIDADYQTNKECPQIFKKFICDVYGNDHLEVWQALISMYLNPACFYGKAVHIVGQSGGGKGTTIRFLQSLFNPASVQSISSFADLANADKRHQNLTGKRFVCLPDLGGYQQQLRDFYELVDNGALSGRALFSSDSYSKEWFCRFIMASVSELKIENSGDGWARRIITLKIQNRTGKPDRRLLKKLLVVKADVISWALSLDKTKRDEILENPEIAAPEIARNNHFASIAGDAIKTFLDGCFEPCTIDNYSSDRIANTALYSMYKAYYKVVGTGKPMALNSFVSHLKTLLPDNYRERCKVKGASNKYHPAGFTGVKVIESVFSIGAGDSFNQDADREYICNSSNIVEGSFYKQFNVVEKDETLDKSVKTSIDTEILHASLDNLESDKAITLLKLQEQKINDLVDATYEADRSEFADALAYLMKDIVTLPHEVKQDYWEKLKAYLPTKTTPLEVKRILGQVKKFGKAASNEIV